MAQAVQDHYFPDGPPDPDTAERAYWRFVEGDDGNVIVLYGSELDGGRGTVVAAPPSATETPVRSKAAAGPSPARVRAGATAATAMVVDESGGNGLGKRERDSEGSAKLELLRRRALRSEHAPLNQAAASVAAVAGGEVDGNGTTEQQEPPSASLPLHLRMLWAAEAGLPVADTEDKLDQALSAPDFATEAIAARKGARTLGWSLRSMYKLPASLLRHVASQIPGVTRPWVYVGMLFTSFCWHNEDNFLYSINYHHAGAPKLWYGVPGSAAETFESAFQQLNPQLSQRSPSLLHQIVTTTAPGHLAAMGVPLVRAIQRPGDCVVTFARAYHAGFNLGVRPSSHESGFLRTRICGVV